MTQTAKARTGKEAMFTGGFSTFSIKDVGKAKEFYGETLGLEVSEEMEGLNLGIPDGDSLFLYPKEDHKPATFTVFNLKVDDIAKAVEDLSGRGIKFLQYDKPMETDENGIFWGAKDCSGPNIAWFEDPSANILSIIEN
ncbi:MAG TPA: VOC family protein [Pyrinomonadaceae bacterium]|nr:VOC family protein [Pyrinomonadaceae bacterium]